VKYLSCASLWGRFLALSANIRLGWIGLPGTNALAYYEKVVNYNRKKLYNIGPGAQGYETFYSRNFKMLVIS
jgi:hypothetical protein